MDRKAGLTPSSREAARAPGRVLLHQDVSAFTGVRNRGGETIPPQFPLARPRVGCWERKRLLKRERGQASQRFGPWGPPLPAQLQVRAHK